MAVHGAAGLHHSRIDSHPGVGPNGLAVAIEAGTVMERHTALGGLGEEQIPAVESLHKRLDDLYCGTRDGKDAVEDQRNVRLGGG